MNWALPEWTVLALLHGPVGRVWQIARPVIYRALDRLEAAELIRPLTVESGPGPQRTIYELTPAGADAVDEWLTEPVRHVRDMRSHLLVKLALLDLRGIDPTPLLRRQQDVLEPIVAALAKERQEGFDGVLAAWRYTNARAALGFVTDLLPGPGA